VFWYRKAAEQGNVRAQSILGHLYDKGEGVPQDDAQSVIWYRKAAEQGDDFAQFHLGYLYEKGRSVPQDYAEAYFWFDLAGTSNEIAAEGRDEVASHLTPADLSREQERARKWFEAHQAKPQ
jgi:TPR repeat protein